MVVSDYAKGLCSNRIIRMIIETAAGAGKASIIDPKRRDFRIYRDAGLIRPNRRELTNATDRLYETDEQAEVAALVAIADTDSAILLTRSERGRSYLSATKSRCI